MFRVGIRGIKPLLMHSPQSIGTPKAGRGAKQTPEDEAKAGLYLNKDSKIVIPGDLLMATLKASAVDFKAPGKGKKTLKFFVDSGIEVLKDAIAEPQTYSIDARPVRIGTAKVMRHRPRFDEWAATFDIAVLDPATWLDVYDKEFSGGAMIRDVLVAAGKFKGIGDFRPRFGRFEVTKFEPIDAAP